MRARTIVGLLVLLLAAFAAGCGGAAETTAGVPDSASLAPADAVAYVTLVTDEDSAQWQKADDLLNVFPGARAQLLESLQKELADEGLTWEEDIAPALGPEVVVVVTASKRPVALTKPESDDKLTALLESSDEELVQGEVDGWTAVAERQADLDAYRTSLAKGTLETDRRFTDAIASLPDETLGRAWADLSTLTRDLDELLQQSGTELDLGIDWIAGAVSAEDDGVLTTMGIRTPNGTGATQYEPELFARVPADAVAALSFGGTQGALDRLQDRVDLDELSRQVEEAVGISLDGVIGALSGEGVLYVRDGGDSFPEVTLVLAPPDPDEAWQTIDTLVRKLAEGLDAQVTAGAEDGVDVSKLVTEQLTVTYARLDDDMVVVTTGAMAISSFRDGGEKLVDTDGFEKAADRVELGERTNGFFYVDVDAIIPFAEGLAGADAIPDEAREAIERIDSFILEADDDGETTRISGFVRIDR